MQKINGLTRRLILLTGISFIFIASNSVPAAFSNSKKVITLPLNHWASQRVISTALGQMIQSLGETVEYKDISAIDQWGALPKGLVHIQLEVWQASMARDFKRMVAQGHIIDMGQHSAQGKEDWWYPEYVEKLCPGLPDWRAMNACSAIFSTPESAGKGVYYAGPWDYGDADIIRALELNFTIHRFENDIKVWQKLAQATKNQQPIMLLNWTPNWIDNQIIGSFVKFPAYSKECELNASWGINKNLVKDCENPTNGWLKKAAWPGLKKQWPCIYQLVKNIDLTNQMIADAAKLAVLDGKSEADAAKIWMEKYHIEVDSWLDLACKKS